MLPYESPSVDTLPDPHQRVPGMISRRLRRPRCRTADLSFLYCSCSATDDNDSSIHVNAETKIGLNYMYNVAQKKNGHGESKWRQIFHSSAARLFKVRCSGRTKKKAVGDDISRRQRRRDVDAVYYMGVHNRNGEIPPSPGNSSNGAVGSLITTIRKLLLSLTRMSNRPVCHRSFNPKFIVRAHTGSHTGSPDLRGPLKWSVKCLRTERLHECGQVLLAAALLLNVVTQNA